jgi:Tfp pilus assembly protein PilF
MLRAVLKVIAGKLSAKPPKLPADDAGDLERAAMQRAGELFESGDTRAAQAIYEEVLRRTPDNLEAQCGLGIIMARAEQYGTARELLLKVLAQEPRHANSLNALGNIARTQEQWEWAEGCYRRALDVLPGDAVVWSNLGLCLREAGKLDAADSALRRALELAPDFPDALLNLAMVSVDIGKAVEARALLKRCLDVAPELPEAHTGLAHLLLQNMEFAEGWPEYEWRFRCAGADPEPERRFPRWDGMPLAGRTLLVRAEQGLGDQIMLASCLPDAIARAGLCMVECDPRLVKLFTRSFPQSTFFPHYRGRKPRWMECDATPDCEIPFGSLPGLFRGRGEEFPRHAGYLRADPERIAYWRGRLAELGAAPKVGLSWRGGAPRTRRTLRSLDLGQLLPLLRTGASFVSVQYGDCQQEIAAFEHADGIELAHWQAPIDDYDETAALVSALDLVISVQTAVVHLAGALGKRTWVMVPSVPEWRYMAQGEVMPWYPSVKLWRQRQRGDWQPVISALCAEMATLQQRERSAARQE